MRDLRKHVRHVALGLVLAGLSCSDVPTAVPPPAPAPPATARVLGGMLVKFSVVGPGEVKASATMYEPAGLPGPRFAITTTSEGSGASFVSGIVGEFLDGAGSFTHGVPGAGGYRYVFGTMKVRNAGIAADGSIVPYTTTRPNLTVIATAVPPGFAGGIEGTPFANLQKFDGSAANPAIAAGIVPTGAVRQTLTGGITTHAPDVLQVFAEAEVAVLAPANAPFAYGYVVRHKTLTNTRTLAANPTATQFDGFITFGIKIPLQTSPADDVYAFSMFFVVVDDSETRVTQSIEEQDAAGQAAFEARVAALTGVSGVTLVAGGSYGGSVAPVRKLCAVRIAGPVTAPVSYLDASAAASCPTLTNVNPTSGVVGTTVSGTLTGTNFVTGVTSVAVSGGGVTVINVAVNSATSLTADFVISGGAATGARTVTVTTPTGNSGTRTFTVTAVPVQVPTLTNINPNGGRRNSFGPVTLTGTNFITGATVAVSGANVFVFDVIVVNSTTITAVFGVLNTAALGARNVTVTTVGGTSGAQTFTVNPGQAEFSFTGAQQSFTVPPDVTSITILAEGAQGGRGANSGGAGANGGSVTATITVTPGEILTIFVGGQGGSDGNTAAGFNGGGEGGGSGSPGGGGGGASDVRQGGSAPANRVSVAGGGGGGGGLFGFTGGAGGNGGGPIGVSGSPGTAGASPGNGGGGGTQAAGGAGGTGAAGVDGAAGALSTGGAGGANLVNGSAGGGGGGYYGGGGGESGNPNPLSDGSPGGGGGGSSFVIATASGVSHSQGVRAGHGRIVITW